MVMAWTTEKRTAKRTRMRMLDEGKASKERRWSVAFALVFLVLNAIQE